MDFEGELPEGPAVLEVVAEEGETDAPGYAGPEVAKIVAVEGDGAEVVAHMAEAPDDTEEAIVVSEETPVGAAPKEKASADVIPLEKSRRLRPSFPKVGRKVAILLVALFVLAFSGVAYATYDYDNEFDGKLLPGIVIAGVDVGGMTPEEAYRAVKAAGKIQLDRNIKVGYEEKTWTVTPRELGARSNARALVDEAVAESDSTGMLAKASMAVFGNELDLDSVLAITYPKQGIRGFVEGAATALDREPIDAGVDYSSGWLEFTEPKEGRVLLRKDSRRALSRALKQGRDKVTLAVKTTKPAITEHKWDQVLLLRIGENKLYLYEDQKITHEYTVATGLPEYPTPTGEYYITEKRYLPTWVNPDPTGWGASMPASIGPGPGNPLGTRALNWDASGIRFHGTEATYSLGYAASHGCVRMAMPDVEELYDLVDVGTPIVSLISSSPEPLYTDSSGAAN
jgi:lipoprotein-anchoring transpeptidase ErfK/SrfK